jgi:hypothetical protein
VSELEMASVSSTVVFENMESVGDTVVVSFVAFD